MLSQFLGEFFMHPAALEYSGNTCSNACAYCFASLRTEERTAQLRKLSNLCLGKSNSDSMIDWFFNNGYPICVSNKSDPFATSNRDNTGVVLQLLDMVPNGVFFQTKGLSKGVDYSLLDGFKKKNVVMYITIDTMNEDVCRRIEPGAPIPQERLELAEYAKSRGWFVEIGVNPCWKPWLPDADFDRLVERLDAIGVSNYYLQALSLNSRDVAKMSAARKARLPDDEIKDAVHDGGDSDYYVKMFFKLFAAKKNVYMNGSPLPCRLMDDEVRFLGKGINAIQSFTNHAWDENRRSGKCVFTFADFIEVMTRGNDEMLGLRNRTLYQYIMNICPDEWRENPTAKNADKFEDVYRTVWNSRRMFQSPSKRFCFATVTDGGRPMRDYYGDKVLYFLGRDGDAKRDHIREISVDDLRGKGVNMP